MKIIENSDNPTEILENDKENNNLSLFYFTASWCGPCKRIFPSLLDLENKLKEQYNQKDIDKNETSDSDSDSDSDSEAEKEKNDDFKKIIFYKVDINENEDYCNFLNIKSVPTFYLYNGDVLLGQTQGANIKNIGELITNNIKIKK